DAFLLGTETNLLAAGGDSPTNPAGHLRLNEAELERLHRTGADVDDAGTNPAPRIRLNEAELVRQRKEGIHVEDEVVKHPTEPQIPVVSDPALARALDL